MLITQIPVLRIGILVDPLQRELSGFLNLPPSIEMAKVEVAGKKAELEKLEREVESKISSLHV